MPSSNPNQEKGTAAPVFDFMDSSSSAGSTESEINISTPSSLEIGQVSAALQEREQEESAQAVDNEVSNFFGSSEDDIRVANTQPTAITISEEASQGLPITSETLMPLFDLETRDSCPVISESEINISVPVFSSLPDQENGKGTFSADDKVSDHFDTSEYNVTTSKNVESAPNNPSKRPPPHLSTAAAPHHDEDAPKAANIPLHAPEEGPKTVTLSLPQANAIKTPPKHTPPANTTPEKAPKAATPKSFRNRSNKRIDAADISAPFMGSRSWYPLTSTQKPVVNLPSVSGVNFPQI